jgi:hypothetical protein
MARLLFVQIVDKVPVITVSFLKEGIQYAECVVVVVGTLTTQRCLQLCIVNQK